MVINDNELDKMIEESRKKVVDIKDKRNVRGKLTKGCWWIDVGEGKKPSFSYQYMAEYILQENYIVRYPNEDGELYIYNKNEGIYIMDKSHRRLKAITYMLDHVTEKNVNEVKNYILSISDVKTEVDIEYVAVKNGLVRYSDKKNIDYTPDIFLVYKIPTNYIPDAYDEFIYNTIEKASCNHAPTIANIHEIFATVLYPKGIVPKMFYLLGISANNGKSTILNLIRNTFDAGGQISAVSPQRLANNNFAGASIYGKMANIVDDMPDIEIEDGGTLKTVITNGWIEVEKKNKDSFSAKVQTPFITASNHYPKFKEQGNQINSRLHIIPFEHDFLKDEDYMPEMESAKKIDSESAKEYVLKLAFDSLALMLQREKEILTPNDRTDEAMEIFKEQSNPLSDYFAVRDKEYFVTRPWNNIYIDYQHWAKRNLYKIPVERSMFKTIVMNEYDLDFKKQVRFLISGEWVNRAGFKEK